MICERCGEDTSVEKHAVDGFSGYLCEECCRAWEEIRRGQ